MEAIAGVDDLAFVLLAALASFGITFTAAGGIDEVAPFIVEQFEDYLSGIGQTVDQVASSFRYGVSKAGQFLANLPVLEYSRNLGIHIQDQFNLSDNSSTSTSVSYNWLLIPVGSSYTQGVVISRSIYMWSHQQQTYAAHNGDTIYFASPNYANQWNAGWYKIPNGTTMYTFTGQDQNTGLWYGSYSPFGISNETGWLIPEFSDMSSFLSALSGFLNPSGSSPDITINTGSIDIPQVGDYSDDDGILIDGLGSWGDTLQDIWDKISGLTLPDTTWPTVTWGAEAAQELVDSLVSAGELTTENSPGFYNGLPLIGGIPDIQFGNLWHYVTDWVGSMSGGLALIGGIMFSLPFVSAFFALVVILLVLSLWRLLRSA